MLNRWKKWITSRLGSGKPPRRRAASQFRGRLESLETRNVLSATIGVVTYDVVAMQVETTSVTIVAVPEYHPIASFAEGAAKFAENPESAAGSVRAFGQLSVQAPNFEPQFESQFGLFFGPPSKPLQSINWNFWWKPGTSAGQGGMLNRSGGYGSNKTMEDIEAGSLRGYPTGEIGPVQRASASSDPTTGLDPNATVTVTNRGTETVSNSQGSPHWSLPSRPQYMSLNQVLQAALMTATGGEQSESTGRLAVELRDLAIEDFSSNSLLLAADFDIDSHDDPLAESNEHGALGAADEDRDDSKNEVIANDLAESLDALARERAAVDAVLAELHDISLADQRDSSADAQPSYHSQSDRELQDYAERFFLSDGAESAQLPFDASAGGMVLLAATGDANSSAFDLCPSTADGDAGQGIMSIAVEAPVGVYQAMDIGVRPATTAADNISNVQPAAKVHADVSAENAPAKKSAQPS